MRRVVAGFESRAERRVIGVSPRRLGEKLLFKKALRGKCRRPRSLATVARATTARCRGVVRAACRLLAGRCASAAARRGLASRLLYAVQLWRKTAVPITCTNAGCWSMLVPAHRDLLCRGALGPAQLALRASLHSAAFNCTLPTQATKDLLCSGLRVFGLRSEPTCSAREEWPPRDLSFDVRIVSPGSELPPRAAAAGGLRCCCCSAGRVARAAFSTTITSSALKP